MTIGASGQVAALGPTAPLPASVPLGTREVMNQPFSADAITAVVQTLADGTHITRQTMAVKMYRDAAGRTRSDRILGSMTGSGPTGPVNVLITDPLAGYRYVLDPANKIAHRSVMAKPRSVPSPPDPASSAAARPANGIPAGGGVGAGSSGGWASSSHTKSEDLGTQTMQGVQVQGRRTTIVYPAGMFGNDRDITAVGDIWTSRELGLVILQVRSDPRTGETTTKIENLSRTQPDPTIFTVPPDYKVQDGPVAGQ